MRLRILSDLHLEFDSSWRYVWQGEDAVLCAGDAANVGARDLFEGLVASCPVPFYYTLGNHDFWGGEVAEVIDHYARLERRHSHFRCLVNQVADLGPFSIAGTPLWTDFSLDGADMAEAAMTVAESHIADFNHETHVRARRPDGDGVRRLDRLRPSHFLPWHRLARRFIQRVLAAGRPTIVLTHWAPSGAVLSERYIGNAINPYYAARCDDLLREPIALWVHGHMHTFDDRVVGGVRVLRNPKGYGARDYSGWNPNLVVDLDR